MKKTIEALKRISILKSLIISIHYFGIKGLLLPVYCGKHVEFKRLEGTLEMDQIKSGIIKIGMNEMGHFSDKTITVFDNRGTLKIRGGGELVLALVRLFLTTG